MLHPPQREPLIQHPEVAIRGCRPGELREREEPEAADPVVHGDHDRRRAKGRRRQGQVVQGCDGGTRTAIRRLRGWCTDGEQAGEPANWRSRVGTGMVVRGWCECEGGAREARSGWRRKRRRGRYDVVAVDTDGLQARVPRGEVSGSTICVRPFLLPDGERGARARACVCVWGGSGGVGGGGCDPNPSRPTTLRRTHRRRSTPGPGALHPQCHCWGWGRADMTVVQVVSKPTARGSPRSPSPHRHRAGGSTFERSKRGVGAVVVMSMLVVVVVVWWWKKCKYRQSSYKRHASGMFKRTDSKPPSHSNRSTWYIININTLSNVSQTDVLYERTWRCWPCSPSLPSTPAARAVA